jgi:predicted RNA binding protein YcfA (HicA-like mRNA interferase family)
VGAQKTLEEARAGSHNLRFRDVTRLVEGFGFRLARVSGSHHIFTHPLVPELINLQSVHGRCKPYQVRQVLDLIDRYNLKLEAKR